MPVESDDDRLSFLDVDEFGVEATYTPAGESGVAIMGIFDGPTIMRDVGDSVPMIDSKSTFLCRTADLPASAAGGEAGDTLLIGAVTWRVVDPQPDGQGMTLLTLSS
jgi:hypothetical protein